MGVRTCVALVMAALFIPLQLRTLNSLSVFAGSSGSAIVLAMIFTLSDFVIKNDADHHGHDLNTTFLMQHNSTTSDWPEHEDWLSVSALARQPKPVILGV